MLKRSALDTSFFETRGQENTVSKDVHFNVESREVEQAWVHVAPTPAM